MTQRFSGPTLLKLREQLKLSRRGLSRASGVPCTTIADIEARGATPRVDTAQALAEAVGCSLAELMEHEETTEQ